MQFKTQSWCQRSILRGRPCIPHHTRTGSEWWQSPAELRCDVMLSALAPSLLLIPGSYSFRTLGVYLLTHMLFGHNSLLIVVGITHVTWNVFRIMSNSIHSTRQANMGCAVSVSWCTMWYHRTGIQYWYTAFELSIPKVTPGVIA